MSVVRIHRQHSLTHTVALPFRLLFAILRFSRLLIENCTNRKLYNSYDVSRRIHSIQHVGTLAHPTPTPARSTSILSSSPAIMTFSRQHCVSSFDLLNSTAAKAEGEPTCPSHRPASPLWP